MEKKEKKKGLLFSAIAGGIATLSLAFTALATPAQEFHEEQEEGEQQDPNKIVLPEVEEEHENTQESILEKIPILIRSAFCAVFWAIGTILLKIVKSAIAFVAHPVIAFFLGWLGIFGILFLIILICLKLLFPDKKLRELINKRILLTTIIGSLIIQCIRTFLPLFWEGYSDYEFTITFVSGLIVILIVLIPEIIKYASEPTIVYEFDGKTITK